MQVDWLNVVVMSGTCGTEVTVVFI